MSEIICTIDVKLKNLESEFKEFRIGLQEDIVGCKNENRKFFSELENSKTTNIEQQEKFDGICTSLNNYTDKFAKLESLVEQYKIENEKLSGEIAELRILNEKTQLDLEKMNDIRTSFNNYTDRFTKIENLVEQYKNENEKLNDKITELSLLHDKTQHVLKNQLKESANKFNESVEKHNRRILKIECLKSQEYTYVWKVVQFNKKITDSASGKQTKMWSLPFYSHKYGYKIRLEIRPNGFDDCKGTHMSLFFLIMKGEDDDILPWPMRKKVRLGIINQETGRNCSHQEYKFRTSPKECQYVFERPKDDMNGCFGNPKFIKLDELLTNAEICKNNVIYVSCIVDNDN